MNHSTGTHAVHGGIALCVIMCVRFWTLKGSLKEELEVWRSVMNIPLNNSIPGVSGVALQFSLNGNGGAVPDFQEVLDQFSSRLFETSVSAVIGEESPVLDVQTPVGASVAVGVSSDPSMVDAKSPVGVGSPLQNKVLQDFLAAAVGDPLRTMTDVNQRTAEMLSSNQTKFGQFGWHVPPFAIGPRTQEKDNKGRPIDTDPLVVSSVVSAALNFGPRTR